MNVLSGFTGRDILHRPVSLSTLWWRNSPILPYIYVFVTQGDVRLLNNAILKHFMSSLCECICPCSLHQTVIALLTLCINAQKSLSKQNAEFESFMQAYRAIIKMDSPLMKHSLSIPVLLLMDVKQCQFSGQERFIIFSLII